MNLALDEVLVIVQVAVVGGNAVIVAHILAAHPLFLGHQGLVQLFAVAGADHAGAGVAKQLLHGFGQIANGGSIGFLDQQIARIGVLKGKHDKVNGLIQVHQKAGHVGIGNSDWLAIHHLLYPKGNN